MEPLANYDEWKTASPEDRPMTAADQLAEDINTRGDTACCRIVRDYIAAYRASAGRSIRPLRVARVCVEAEPDSDDLCVVSLGITVECFVMVGGRYATSEAMHDVLLELKCVASGLQREIDAQLNTNAKG